jgi:carboxymethylenebutenolidase
MRANRCVLWETVLLIAFMVAFGGTDAVHGAAAVESKMVTFSVGTGSIRGYLAHPSGDGPYPAIVIVHEWWGLSDWIKQNADKLAVQGYVALAVDLYGGKVTDDPAVAHELMRAVDRGEALANLKGGIGYLKSLAYVAKGKPIGAIGWCMGGGYAREIAQESDAIGPTVICYGSVTTEPDQLAKLRNKPILGIFGEDDRGIPVDKVQQFSQALRDKGSKVGLHVYKSAGHGFMRPGGPQYNASAATDAWEKIHSFLAETLKP